MLILERRGRARADGLADYRAGAFAFLKPIAPVHTDLSNRGPDRQRDRADRVAISDGQLAKKYRQLRV